MSAQPKPKPKAIPFHLEPQHGSQLATYPLIRAVYMDELDLAKAILAAEPGQINMQEPFAGLTSLHIAIFRQNVEIVQLLIGHPQSEIDIRDNFGRNAADMLAYTSNDIIFKLVLELKSSRL